MDLFSQIKVNDASIGFQGGHFSEEDSPEWLKVVVDNDDKVLEGIQVDGTKVISSNIDFNGVSYTVIDNPEWLQVVVTDDNKILYGVRRDGSFYSNSIDALSQLESRVDELEKKIDNNVLAIEYEAETGNIYAITGEESTMNITMDEDGNIYVEQTLDDDEPVNPEPVEEEILNEDN